MTRMNHEARNKEDLMKKKSLKDPMPKVWTKKPKRGSNRSSIRLKKYKSKFDGICYSCEEQYFVGEDIIYNFPKQAGRHSTCKEVDSSIKTTNVDNKKVHMRAKFPGTCYKCKKAIKTGTNILYEPGIKRASHTYCGN